MFITHIYEHKPAPTYLQCVLRSDRRDTHTHIQKKKEKKTMINIALFK